jgi:hypothetical protein
MYTPQERLIFRHANGEFDADGKPVMVAKDPFVINDKWDEHFQKTGENPEDLRKILAVKLDDLEPDARNVYYRDMQRPAARKLAAAVAVAFEIKPLQLDGSGLTETELGEVYSDFLEWELEKKLIVVDSPNSPTPTDDSPGANAATPNTTDSASISPESSASAPEPSLPA